MTKTYDQVLDLAASRATAGVVGANVAEFIVALFGDGSEADTLRIHADLDRRARAARRAKVNHG